MCQISFIARLSLRCQTECALESALRLCTDRLRLRRAVFEQDDVRDRLDAITLGEVLFLVVVDLHELEVALLSGALEHGRDRVARSAPVGPEVDEHGSGRSQDLLLKRGVGDMVAQWVAFLSRVDKPRIGSGPDWPPS